MSKRELVGVLLIVGGCGGGQMDDGASFSGADPTVTNVTTGGESVDTSATGTPTSTDGVKLDLPAMPDLGDATTGECAAQTLAPQIGSLGVDIVLVVDTSSSMGPAIAAVEASINLEFAQILEDSGIDYRLIVVGDYPPGQELSICVSMPLSDADCTQPPPVPAVTDKYKHYDAATGSTGLLDNILAWYTAPDPHGLAPGGYRDLLRDGTRKVILTMTDGDDASPNPIVGDAFDASLLELAPPLFGTPGDRQYVLHAIVTMAANDPPTQPWYASDPIQGEGESIQRVSVLSGGWRFPLANVDDFDVLFEEIATDVVENIPIACDFPIPTPDSGTIDPDTIEIDYHVDGEDPPRPLHQVVDLASCDADAFYIVGETVTLCPGTCAEVQADIAARLDVRYGCDVGFNPG